MGTRNPMEVQCEICKAEYEFDDALVTARGTTVRCTQCGHQFKVKRGGTSEGADEWVILTSRGDELRFRSLREMQRAILEKQVTRSDLFVVGGGEPRALGSVVELEPFFEGMISSRPPPSLSGEPSVNLPPNPGIPRFDTRTHDHGSDMVATPRRHVEWPAGTDVESSRSVHGPARDDPGDGVERAGQRSSTGHVEIPNSEPLPVAPGSTPSGSSSQDLGAARRRMDTLRPPDSGGVPPPPSALPGIDEGGTSRPPSSSPEASRHSSRAARQASPWVAVPNQITSLPVPSQRSLRSSSRPVPPDAQSPARGDAHSMGDDFVGTFRRRRVGGWIVAVALVVALSVVGWGAMRPYLLRRAAPVVSSTDGRVAGLLGEGERALFEGDIDVAEEAIDKASALAEHDARVLRDQSRLAALKGDIPWLALKLLPPGASGESRTASVQLASNVARAKRTASEAYGLSPDDPANACALIDALRLEGSAGAARALVSKVVASSGDRDVAYALAALDLTEPEPMWSTVVERLRLSAASDVQAGRARAALVYALGRSGDRAGAEIELGKLDLSRRPYPLLPLLHKWLEGLAPPSSASAAHSAARKMAGTAPSLTAPQGGTDNAAGDSVSSDAGGALQAAAAALRNGAYLKAEQIYRALVARNDRDSEALSGLGDVAHAQGDVRGAMAAYRRAITVNPSYLPALVGLADAEWAAGDRAQAQRAYSNVVDHFPEGTYPAYVKERSEETPSPAPSSLDGVRDQGSSDEGREPPTKPSAVDDDR